MLSLLHHPHPLFNPPQSMSTSHLSIYIPITVINDRIVTLWSESDSKGLTIPYTNISLHAAQAPGSRGEGSRGCIYMQLDNASHLISSESATNGNNHESPDDVEEEEEDSDTRGLVEVYLVPSDESTCNSSVFVRSS
jgi:Regulator of volume decrease after cellular swelling